MPLEWTEKYSVGLRELDEQHRIILGLVGEISRLSALGAGMQEVQASITRLRHYAKEHFDLEERLMARAEHQGTGEHVEQHAAFLKQIGRFQRACRAGECSVRGEVIPFLDAWLDRHFLERDLSYVHCMAESGVGMD